MAIPGLPEAPFYLRWFRDGLRWPLLFFGGPVAVVTEGIARAADAVLADIRWFVDQFNPATCEPEYVDKYGAARGLVRHYRESASQWRRRVCAAHAWHKLAGRTLGMPQILAHFGYAGAVMINRATEGQPDLWAHFRAELVTGDYPVSDEDWELIRWVLNTTKPAKSVLESVTVRITTRAVMRVAAARISGESTTIAPWSPPEIQAGTARQRLATGNQSVELVRIYQQMIHRGARQKLAPGNQSGEIIIIYPKGA